MSKADEAMAIKTQGFSCSQAVFATFAEDFALDQAIALRISDPFGGGLANTGGTCGAVTGATMAIGLKCGRSDAADSDAKARTVEFTRELMQRFEDQHGSLLCKELLGCKIDTPEKYAAARESGVPAATCPALVRSACDVLEEIL